MTDVMTYPVPVVNGPVYDENFLDVRQSEELPGRDGDRVEVAEAHGLL